MTSTDPCDCGARDRARGENVARRSVLRGLLAAGVLGTLGGIAGQSVTARYAFASGPASGLASGPTSGLSSSASSNSSSNPSTSPAAATDVLVVVCLRGGFDGLSAVVPAADPDYLRLRPTLAVPSSRLLKADPTFGLHPAMAPLMPFWRNGSLAAVHAVGQADPTRSHFEAMAELERAAPGTSLRTGWLDRTLGLQPGSSIFKATQLGGGEGSGALTGPQPELAMSAIDGFELSGAWDAAERARWATALGALHRGAPAALAAPAAGALSALATTAALKSAGYTPENGADYPDTDTAKALRDVARLIKADVGLQVACLEQGDWDMHADLGTADAGRFTTSLTELAGGLAAFATDLGPTRLAGVTVVTLSEFGRRVEENGSGGLDHGHGNAVLLLGGGVVGGRVHGRWPGLTDQALLDGDLAGTTDYRVVLAEILTKRCGLGSASAVFPGLAGAPLGVVRPR